MATSDQIAHNVCTHPARVRKVLSCLRKQGYVAAKEGTGGGFKLNCDPDQVSLAELYKLTATGSIQPGWCSGNEDMDCMIACNMAKVMGGIYSEAEQRLIDFFGQMTLRDVLDRAKSMTPEPK